MDKDNNRNLYTLLLLFAINLMNFYDRQIPGALTEPIRREWHLTDTQLGALGTAFILLYALIGIPLGRLADVWSRKKLLSLGVLLWSLMTLASGWATGFWTLFLARLGVGVGEASCAPASSSLIGDLFPPERRARALSVFMLGLPVGLALSLIVSGSLAHAYHWRSAFLIAGLPGLLLAFIAWFHIREPGRGAAEPSGVGARTRAGSPYALVLGVPTMWWIILSGALHNFNMYAISTFLSAFLSRFHGVTVRQAGLITGVVFGAGIVGLLIGGQAADAAVRRRANGRLLVATAGILLSVPLIFLALTQPAGAVRSFMLLMLPGCMLMYTYYATIYSAIQDVIEPALRGTAMALYFFAMYLLGAGLGPIGTGLISDFFARRAAGSHPMTEDFKAEGLHQAMYVIPLLGALLVLVLFAASRTVAKDRENLQRWLKG